MAGPCRGAGPAPGAPGHSTGFREPSVVLVAPSGRSARFRNIPQGCGRPGADAGDSHGGSARGAGPAEVGAVCSTEDVAQDKVRETKVREEEEVGSEGASRIRKWLRWRRWEERAAWGFAGPPAPPTTSAGEGAPRRGVTRGGRRVSVGSQSTAGEPRNSCGHRALRSADSCLRFSPYVWRAGYLRAGDRRGSSGFPSPWPA